LLPFPPEGGLIDTKNIGRFLKGFGGSDHPANVGLFDGLQGNGVAQLNGGGPGRDGGGEVPGVHDLGRAEDGGPFDRVPQFPDIPRPGISPQGFEGVFPEALEGLVVLDRKNISMSFAKASTSSGRSERGGRSIWMTLSR